MTLRALALVPSLFLAAADIGCPGADPPPAAAAGRSAAASDPTTVDTPATSKDSGSELTAALEALAAAGARARPVVPHTKFTPLLPDRLAGLAGAAAEGRTDQAGAASASRASREYSGEGKTLTIRIIDRPMTGSMAAAAIELTAMAAEETDELVERPYSRGDHPGRIKVFKRGDRARAVLMVDRLMLEVEAAGYPGQAGVDAALAGLDLDALAALVARPRRRPAPTRP